MTGLEGAAAYNTGNYCCSGKAIRTTYSECAFVALDIKPEMRMLHIVICDLSRSTIFLYTDGTILDIYIYIYIYIQDIFLH